jgi:penicillin-binding protein 1A
MYYLCYMTRKIIRIFWIFWVSVFLSTALYFYIVKINLFGMFGGMPSLDVLENPELELSSSLYSADGQLLGEYFKVNRSGLEYYDISENAVKALIATEDIRFYEHSGIDFKALGRAMIFSIMLKKNRGGGSTISQQLAKNLFKTRTDIKKNIFKSPFLNMLIIKTKEWILAVQIEKCYTKEEIITMYLNTVFFGNNCFGIKAASETFFNIPPNLLSVEQACLLIGLLKGPTRYSPIYNKTDCLLRRNVVIKQMYINNFLSIDQYNDLKDKPIELTYNVKNQHTGIAPYFRAMAKKFLFNWAMENGYNLFSSGLKIYTTIDSRVQKVAEEAVQKQMARLQERFYKHWGDLNPWVDDDGKEMKDFINQRCIESGLYKSLKQQGLEHDAIMEVMNTPVPTKLFSWKGELEEVISPIDEIKYNKKLLHAGLLTIDPETNHIKAWVGGINHKFFEYDHVRQGKRQPGSTFKPIVYVTAIDNGYSPFDEIRDVPVTFKISDKKIWTPQNWNKSYSGNKMTLKEALNKSINSVTAYLIKQLGPELVCDYANRLGVKSALQPFPALGLGSCDISLYELVGVYNTFLNKGRYADFIFISRIEDKNGNVLANFTPQTKEAISEKTAYTMIEMLKNDKTRLLNPTILQDNEVAFKTGTTSNQSDGWFIGMTHNLVTGIWVGGDNRCIHFRTMAEGAGAVTALPIWKEFMTNLYQDEELRFLYPKGMFEIPQIYKLKVKAKAEIVEQEAAKLSEDSSETPALNIDEIY